MSVATAAGCPIFVDIGITLLFKFDESLRRGPHPTAVVLLFICSEWVYLFLNDPATNVPSTGIQVSYSCITEESNSHVFTYLVRTAEKQVSQL